MGFTGRFLCNLIMKILTQKFSQNSVAFEIPGILPEQLKTLTSSNLVFLMLFTDFKRVFEGFLFRLNPKLFAKLKKIWFLNTHRNQVFSIFITKDLRKIKKSQTLFCRKC